MLNAYEIGNSRAALKGDSIALKITFCFYICGLRVYDFFAKKTIRGT